MLQRKKRVSRMLLVIMIFFLMKESVVCAKEEVGQLYARSAVLMDADSGRILFAKNGEEQRAMASTTKIMTCILALEAQVGETVTVSERAASQPRVHLGMRKGEVYKAEDLLYSMMLESHNDSAVAIAEKVAGSVEAFVAMMNEKAEAIGCLHTHFVTPNGLDGEDEKGKHSTTAADLAKIMSYCINQSVEKEMFLKITGTKNYSFSEGSGKRRFSCYNHNAFLQMMEGALSGKTGFTVDAGYCYVGALRREGRTFVVALLACGWPNHKIYKWQDMQKLMDYAIANYQYRQTYEPIALPLVAVEDGIEGNEVAVKMELSEEEQKEKLCLLLRKDEKLTRNVLLPKGMAAPIQKGQRVGSVSYRLEGKEILQVALVADRTIHRKYFGWFLLQRAREFFVQKAFDFTT